ncbi:uncharacterized protein LOC135628637 [Musa acuminata AAA Group]|uniref:uncharacterized protein LOC135628637 n=1 Tax=Musa acuminata AAA Group TaxID=214697 RepID=UPI0031E3D2D2
MGKSQDEHQAPAPQIFPPEGHEGNACDGCPRCRSIGRIARPRCVTTLVLAVAILLLVVFWLPPFVRRYEGAGRPDPDPRFSADVVASFKLQKPVGLLNSNIGKLQLDIFEEIGVPDSSIAVIYLEPLDGSNWTNVVFGVWPYRKNSTLSSTGLSILRSSFMSLVIQQSTLHLTTTLFGNSSFFEVLKFPGGITIIPLQRVFLLQNVQMLFNFTLNFPIYQVQDKVNELKDQMKAGLLLNWNENLYVRLINLEGTTVSPPTIVQTSIVLAVGNRRPSLPRWKELAHTIQNSSVGNLGLNHTVFGRVKQIRLSSFLQHSSNNGSNTSSPHPSPQPNHHLHHHHHHHKHHFPVDNAPGPAPPDTAPRHGYEISPSGCGCGFSSKPKGKGYSAPAAVPVDAPKHSAAPAAVLGCSYRPVGAPMSAQNHLLAPRAHENPPVPAPSRISASPSPAVSFMHVPPPSKSVKDTEPPDRTPSISPASYSSSGSGKSFAHLVLVPLLYLSSSL